MSQVISPGFVYDNLTGDFGTLANLNTLRDSVNTALSITPSFMSPPTSMTGVKNASLNAIYPNVGSAFVFDNSLYIKTDVSKWVVISASTFGL